MWRLGSITERSVCGFCIVPDPLEGNLGHPAEGTQRCILQDQPVPISYVCHPGTWACAGGRSCAPRGTPISAVGQGNPTLQPGAWGTRHCLHTTLAPTPCHRHMWKMAPCSCIPQRDTRGWFDVCFMVTSATGSPATDELQGEPPSSCPEC